ncbi:MAG: hypothetical protein HFH99_09000 [Lachnospiraceae bacterium]|uniref:hypothetical protein n=1 Tax=uncultured Acetatifactor sp. TaxID=1671927 RepID=UPI0026397C79|nr:hypothetical protein [uncultured Acetatifactor sp.]MCI8696899.1 hypothetical protein [Lachnospiraceae bacterium]
MHKGVFLAVFDVLLFVKDFEIKDFEENAVVKYKALPYNERNYSNFPIVKCMLLKGS